MYMEPLDSLDIYMEPVDNLDICMEPVDSLYIFHVHGIVIYLNTPLCPVSA